MVSRFCNRCGQLLPPNATTCPRCNAAVAAAPMASPAPGGAPGVAPAATAGAEGTTLSARRTCANCRAQMRWVGHYSLRATGPPGAAGPTPGPDTPETLLPFSLYYCQTCGRFDFYYPGT